MTIKFMRQIGLARRFAGRHGDRGDEIEWRWKVHEVQPLFVSFSFFKLDPQLLGNFKLDPL